MDHVSLMLGSSNLFVALLVLVLSVPLIRGRVKMNPFYGIRVARAYESEESWYRINRYGGIQLALCSVPLALFGIGLYFIPLEGNLTWILISAVAPLLYLVPFIRILSYAGRGEKR